MINLVALTIAIIGKRQRFHSQPVTYKMNIKLIGQRSMEVFLFGIAKDIVGKSVLDLSDYMEKPNSVGELILLMNHSYPEFSKLSSIAVAVNGEYASNDVTLQSNDEIAIIPPVSGG